MTGIIHCNTKNCAFDLHKINFTDLLHDNSSKLALPNMGIKWEPIQEMKLIDTVTEL